MKRNYVLIYDPEGTNSIMGVYSSGKKLADACSNLMPTYRKNCLVKAVPVDTWCGNMAGFDFQGTFLDEFMACPIARDDAGE